MHCHRKCPRKRAPNAAKRGDVMGASPDAGCTAGETTTRTSPPIKTQQSCRLRRLRSQGLYPQFSDDLLVGGCARKVRWVRWVAHPEKTTSVRESLSRDLGHLYEQAKGIIADPCDVPTRMRHAL